jgi:hypothetical protein
MAFTFDELATWWAGKISPRGSVKLVVTQEDGRTGFSDGVVHGFDSSSNSFFGSFEQHFNDRVRRFAIAGVSYEQGFDKHSIDHADFVFTKTGSNTFELRLTLLSWGNAQILTALTSVAQAKIYTGWGETIGGGSGLALYAVSLNGAEEQLP